MTTSAAGPITDHFGPMLLLRLRMPFAKTTVLVLDGTLVPIRDHNSPHKQVR